MPVLDANLGQQLGAWLDRLDAEGFQVGVRERLVVQTLLAQLTADGPRTELQSLREVLNIVGPLVCTKAEQQRQYAVLLEEFLVQPGGTTTHGQTGRGAVPPVKPWQFTWWQIFLVLLVLGTAGVAVTWQLGLWQKLAAPPSVLEAVDKSGAPPPLKELPAPIGKPIYVPVSSLPIPTSTQQAAPGWIGPVRYATLAVGAVSSLGLIWLVWARWRRQLYLQAIRTDEAVRERFLKDPHPVVLEPSAGIVRGASRQLRQRYVGEREVIDLPLTIRATMAAGGAFTPRYRALPHTPEYLILIDQRHPADHHTAYSQTLVNALKEAGVAVQVYYFEGSPETGCWQVRRTSRGQDRIKMTSISELTARFAGHRLLVFGDAQALVDESEGEPHAWANYLKLFPQRAWLTPMPLASWGPLEQVVDEQGFLLLPIQQESLTTMASWFSSGHLGLEVAEDWPLNYPPMLRGQDVAWVARQAALPPKDQEELLFELRNYLGATRFQWLCACGLFPAVSPAITLALGRELVGEDMRELALGLAAIGALPWFRYASMPAWLRQALIGRLNQANETRFRNVIEKRLSDAVEDRDGLSLLSVAEKKRMVAAWFRKRSGLARDVVLVDFLYRGPLAKLAQRLPEALRKRLFHGGLPAYGLTSGMLWLLLMGLLIGVLGMPGIGDRFFTVPVPALQVVGALRGQDVVMTDAVFGPDGKMVATLAEVVDKEVYLWDVASGQELHVLRGHAGMVGQVRFSPDGKTVVTARGDSRFAEDFENSGKTDKTARLWDVTSGRELHVLRGHEGSVLSTQFAPDGKTIITVSFDKTARLWDVTSGRELHVLRGHEASIRSVQFAPDGKTVVTASHDSTARLWDVASGRELYVLRGRASAMTSVNKSARSAEFSPDGMTVVVLYEGILPGDRMPWLWDVASGKELYRLGEFGNEIWSVQFSPNGKRLVTAMPGGTVTLWGEPLDPALDLVGCSTEQGVTKELQLLTDRVTRAVTDRILPPLSPVAYHPSAWQRPDGMELVPYETVLYGGNDPATAEKLAMWFDEQTNVTKQTGQPGWKVEQTALLGSQRFVVNTCATPPSEIPAKSNPVQGTEPKVSGATTKISPPTKEKPLAGLRLAVFGCTVAEREAKNIIKSILPAIGRLGGKPIVQMVSEAKRASFAPSDKGLNIRITREVQKEVAGAEALRSQPEFESENWEQIFTLQQSQNYLSIFVCPVDFSAPEPSLHATPTDSTPNVVAGAVQQVPQRPEQSLGIKQSGSSNQVQQNVPARSQKRILWVDDRPDNNRGEIARLNKLLIEVVQVTSTKEAFARLESERKPFDLIISDWQRPELHLNTLSAGIHFLRELRAQKISIPVVFYHSVGDEKERVARHEQALRDGAFGETVTPNELLELVTKVLGDRVSKD